MSNQPMPFNWAVPLVSVFQFATRVRQACAGSGTITTAEIGYEYSTKDGVLYRIVGGAWQPLGDAMELAALCDEELYRQCR